MLVDGMGERRGEKGMRGWMDREGTYLVDAVDPQVLECGMAGYESRPKNHDGRQEGRSHPSS